MLTAKSQLSTSLLHQKPATRIKTLVFSILLISLVLAFLLDLALGAVEIPINQVNNLSSG